MHVGPENDCLMKALLIPFYLKVIEQLEVPDFSYVGVHAMKKCSSIVCHAIINETVALLIGMQAAKRMCVDATIIQPRANLPMSYFTLVANSPESEFTEDSIHQSVSED